MPERELVRAGSIAIGGHFWWAGVKWEMRECLVAKRVVGDRARIFRSNEYVKVSAAK
jgi:hypothetical protein